MPNTYVNHPLNRETYKFKNGGFFKPLYLAVMVLMEQDLCSRKQMKSFDYLYHLIFASFFSYLYCSFFRVV